MPRTKMPDDTNLRKRLATLDLLDEEIEMWLFNGYYIELNTVNENGMILTADGEEFEMDDDYEELLRTMKKLAIARWNRYKDDLATARAQTKVQIIEVDSTRESLEARNG